MKVKTLTHERLFEGFFDETDGVTCVQAAITPSELNQMTAAQGWRFPLLLDAGARLCDQVAASAFAPASSRFGPYCDNITGMNWQLPNGKRVRLGERVVKSTTGYDLLRFLLGADERFGRPTDFVLRLRPDCAGGGVFCLQGSQEHLQQAVSEILRSSYLHWLEAVDWITGDGHPSPWLRIGVHCPCDEWGIFAHFIGELARRHQLSWQPEESRENRFDGLPDLVVKTTPDRVLALAANLASQSGGRCVALCHCGVVHVHLPCGSDPAARINALVQPVADALHEIGGDWRSRHCQCAIIKPEEGAWLQTLLNEWGL